jgi:heme/copper-type cytochrome/quinol oxidase subunit 2
LIFALAFVIVFTTVIIRSYRKDKTEQPDYFKGSSRVLIAIAVVIILLFTIKLLTVQ